VYEGEKKTPMEKCLSADTVEQYRVRGYHFPVSVLTPERAEIYRRMAEDLHVSGRDKSVTDDPRISFKLHVAYKWLDEMAHDPLVLDAVEDIIGPDILVWSSALFIKESDDASFAGWHQDTNYSTLKGPDQTSIWIALSPSLVKSGCLRVMPGSHKVGRLAHEQTEDMRNILARQERLIEGVDESKAMNIELQPGEMSFHHLAMVHGSARNNSGYRRIGYAVRYIAPHVEPVGRHETAMLARGEDRYGHYDLEPRPQANLDSEAVAAFERAVAIRTSNFYEKKAVAATASLS